MAPPVLREARVVLERLKLPVSPRPAASENVRRGTASGSVSQTEASDSEASVMSCESGVSTRSRRLKRPRSTEPLSGSGSGGDRSVVADTDDKPAGRRKKRPKASGGEDSDVESCTATELGDKLRADLAAIKEVAKVSKGLKGTSQKALKDAVDSIAESVEVLVRRTPEDEVALLKAQIRRQMELFRGLQEDNRVLRQEIADLRRGNCSSDSQESELSALRRVVEDLCCRFAAQESRTLRPPLAADRGRAEIPPATYAAKAAAEAGPARATRSQARPPPAKPSARPPTTAPPATAPPAKKKGAGKPKGKPAPTPKAPPSQAVSAPVAAKPSSGEWQTVGETKRAKKDRQKAAKAARKKAAASAPKRLRAPKSAAVVITIQPTALERGMEYAKVLATARERVDLAGLGIQAMVMKTTRTGARLLQVGGSTSGQKADALAEKLRETFDEGDVRVSRPIKCADLRISGLDDSVTAAEVAAAVAKVGGCSADQSRPGALRPGPGGLRTCIINCPVAAAQKVADGRRLLVGWVSAQVKLLGPRPARCFRCLGGGHVGVKCTSQVDCSGKCFRCGKAGHTAGTCDAPPHCIICAAAGKPADHQLGSKPCARTRPTKSGQSKTAAKQVQPSKDPAPPSQRQEGTEMECQ